MFGRIIPQYWRHFLLMIPTTLPVGRFSSLLSLSFSKVFASSSTSIESSEGFSVLSSRTIPLGAVHSFSGRISTATMSPSTARFSDSRP